MSESDTAGHRTVDPAANTASAPIVNDRQIGSIICETRKWSDDQLQQILQHQQANRIRFGEAAIALGYASAEDVLFALSQQFHYPYAAADRRQANPELVALNQPFGVQSESIRATRTQVMMRLRNASAFRKAIAIISPQSGDGKSFFAANLSISLAQLGGRTLLVDADMRGPRQHAVFGLDNAAGLSGILTGKVDSNVIQQVTDVPDLFVLPVGITPPNPLELVERPAFRLLMRELLSKFDHVVVDTPAAQFGSDSAVIAAGCGAALVVARHNKSQVRDLHEMLNRLGGTPIALVGAVMNEF